MKIPIRPKPVAAALTVIIFGLLLACLSGIAARRAFGIEEGVFNRLILLFDFDSEANIPTLFSSLLMLCCSALAVLVAVHRHRTPGTCLHWYGIALVMGFMTIDETVSIHERLGNHVRLALDTTGFLYFAWVLPYSAALLILAILYIPFLVRLPRKTVVLFVASGAVYVTGAIGFELLGGPQAIAYGEDSIPFALTTTVEELLEMAGLSLFIFSLLTYIDEHLGKVSISIDPGAEA